MSALPRSLRQEGFFRTGHRAEKVEDVILPLPALGDQSLEQVWPRVPVEQQRNSARGVVDQRCGACKLGKIRSES